MTASVAIAALLFPKAFSAGAQGVAGWFLVSFDLWTLLLPSACLLLCLVLLVHPAGRTVIGGEEAAPEFRFVTWAAMMFAAGMGAGLVFWGAAEPLILFVSPPPGSGIGPETAEARSQALAITQFHWALHAWAIYAVAAVAIGISQDFGQSVLPSRPFRLLPKPWRRGIDIVALIAVLFGLVASLGQGVFQVGAGIATVSGGAVPSAVITQISFLVLLTVAYLGSALLGLRRGIAILSNVNMVLALLLATYILVAGPTAASFATIGESFVSYLKALPQLSFDLRDEGAPRDWTRAWSLTYFLWWVAWTPFVGVFLARISRGRSVRSFMLAAVLIPSFATLVWFSVLGGAALSFQSAGTDLGVSDFATAPQATYRLLENLPLTTVMQSVTMILVAIFLVTSADSGAYVMAMFSEENRDPSQVGRLFWGGVLALLTGATVLSEGGQAATRALAVAGAIPLTFLLAAQGVAASWLLFRRRQVS